MPIDYTAPFNNALRNWVDSARTGYLVRQDQADRQNAMARQQQADAMRQQEFDMRRQEYEARIAEQQRQQQQQANLQNAMSLAAQGRQVTVPGFDPPPISGNFGEFDTGGWALPETTQQVPYSYEEQVGMLAPYLGPEKFLEMRKPQEVDYTFNPEAGMLVPDRPGVPAQPVAGYVPPPKKDQFIDWGHGQKRNMATGEIVRVPTAPVAGSGTGREKPPAGYRWETDPTSGLPTGNLVAIEGGPAEKQGFEAATKQAMLMQAQQNLTDAAGMIFDKDGNVNRGLLVSMSARVPFSEGRTLYTMMYDAVEAKLRAESGAAVPEPEVARMAKRYIPSPLDNDDTIKRKMTQFADFIGTALEVTGRGRTPNKTSTPNQKQTTVPRPARKGYKWQQNTETGEFREVPVGGR